LQVRGPNESMYRKKICKNYIFIYKYTTEASGVVFVIKFYFLKMGVT